MQRRIGNHGKISGSLAGRKKALALLAEMYLLMPWAVLPDLIELLNKVFNTRDIVRILANIGADRSSFRLAAVRQVDRSILNDTGKLSINGTVVRLQS